MPEEITCEVCDCPTCCFYERDLGNVQQFAGALGSVPPLEGDLSIYFFENKDDSSDAFLMYF